MMLNIALYFLLATKLFALWKWEVSCTIAFFLV